MRGEALRESRKPGRHAVLAVAAFVMFPPLGALALYYAFHVDEAWYAISEKEGRRRSRSALAWAITGIGVGLLMAAGTLALAWLALGAAVQAAQTLIPSAVSSGIGGISGIGSPVPGSGGLGLGPDPLGVGSLDSLLQDATKAGTPDPELDSLIEELTGKKPSRS